MGRRIVKQVLIPERPLKGAGEASDAPISYPALPATTETARPTDGFACGEETKRETVSFQLQDAP